MYAAGDARPARMNRQLRLRGWRAKIESRWRCDPGCAQSGIQMQILINNVTSVGAILRLHDVQQDM